MLCYYFWGELRDDDCCHATFLSVERDFIILGRSENLCLLIWWPVPKNVFLVHEWRHKFLSNNLIKSSFCGFHFLISCLGSLHASIARICRRKVKKGQNPQMNQWILFACGFYIIIFSCTEMSTCDITIFRLSWRLVHVIVNFIFTV